jgi:hypothetical protein
MSIRGELRVNDPYPLPQTLMGNKNRDKPKQPAYPDFLSGGWGRGGSGRRPLAPSPK